MAIELSELEQLELDERGMHMDFQKKFYELDLHERKQETIRRGLEILSKLFQCDKNRMEKHQDVLNNKLSSFLLKLAPHD